MTKRSKYDSAGFISCDCKAPRMKGDTNIGSNKKLVKSLIKRKKPSAIFSHRYSTTKGTDLFIGDSRNTCKCKLFSGKDRSFSRRGRKDPSVVRSGAIKGVDSLMVRFD